MEELVRRIKSGGADVNIKNDYDIIVLVATALFIASRTAELSRCFLMSRVM